MLPPIQFRPAGGEDLPRLVQLINSAYRGDVSRQGWTTEADLLDGIRTDEDALAELLIKPGSLMLLCLDTDEQILGCVYLKDQVGSMYLGMLTVRPDLQARRIGKQLLRAAEQHAAALGCHSIVMTVISVRNELIHWYERKGYHKTGERKAFPDDPRFGVPKQPLEFVILQKSLVEKIPGNTIR